MPSGEFVTPDVRDAERLQGFPAGWTAAAGTGKRNGPRWKLVGNAVSVPVARWIGRRLVRPGSYAGTDDVRLGASERWPSAAWSNGSGVFASAASAWPVRYTRRNLAEFLKYPTRPLSSRATAGFLKRAGASTLRFPNGLLTSLEDHLERVVSMESLTAG
jgi:DNA (cytosine-5)-methyltransferase 1